MLLLRSIEQRSEHPSERFDRLRHLVDAGQEAAEPVLVRRESNADDEQLAQGTIPFTSLEYRGCIDVKT